MADRPLKRWSGSLVIRKTQIKCTASNYKEAEPETTGRIKVGEDTGPGTPTAGGFAPRCSPFGKQCASCLRC